MAYFYVMPDIVFALIWSFMFHMWVRRKKTELLMRQTFTHTGFFRDTNAPAFPLFEIISPYGMC